MIAPPPYDGMEVFLTIKFPPDYPFKPPKLSFDDPVPYHPFMRSKDGGVCNCCLWDCFFKTEWSPRLTVQQIIPLVRDFLEHPAEDARPNVNPNLEKLLQQGESYWYAAVRAHYRKQNASVDNQNNIEDRMRNLNFT